MIGWLLDTNVISALINPNGAPSVKSWSATQREENFFISILALAELDKGVEHLPEHDENRYRIIGMRDGVEERFSGRILPVDNGVVRRWGRISGRVKRVTGHPPAVIVSMLAATAIEHNLYLVTRNVRDVRECGAIIFDPWHDNVAQFPLRRR